MSGTSQAADGRWRRSLPAALDRAGAHARRGGVTCPRRRATSAGRARRPAGSRARAPATASPRAPAA